jgi:hypothetical protein
MTIAICTYIMVKLQSFINAFGYSRLWLLVRRWESFVYKLIFMKRSSMLIDTNKWHDKHYNASSISIVDHTDVTLKVCTKPYTWSLPWSQVQMITNKTNLHPNPCWMDILKPSFLWWDMWQLCNCCLGKACSQLKLGC